MAILDIIRNDPQLLVAHVPHAVAIGMVVVEVKPTECWIKLPYAPNLVGNFATGVVHGGVITTLLDQSSGSAVILTLEDPVSIATLDLRIDYMKPATPGLDIIGYSHCYKVTTNVAFVRGVAYHERPEDPIATSVGTFMLGANRTVPGVFSRGT